jgi:hypothetical protein
MLYMSTSTRLDKLYDSNIPGIRNTNECCDLYKEWYGKIIANLTVTNSALISWFNSWVASYDPTLTDVSLSSIYNVDKPLFAELQTILNDQKSFFDSVKASRLPNADAISFAWASSTNQNKSLKGKYTYGIISNLSTTTSSTTVLDTAVDMNLDTNMFIVQDEYQIGNFNEESILLDLHFGGAVPGNISDLFDRVCCSTDGTSIVSQNKRLVEELTFNINRASSIQTMLTYIKR